MLEPDQRPPDVTPPGASRRIKVLHVFKDAYPPTYGGVEQHIWDLTRSLGQEFEFEILTSFRSWRHRRDEVDGVRVTRVREFGRALSTPITPGWWNEMRRREDTVFHFHLPLPVAELLSLAWWPSGPVVASFYADVMRAPALARRYAPVQQRFLERVDRIVVSSEALATTSPALAGHQDRLRVIPFGVDPEEWPAHPHRVAEIRAAQAGPLVLFLGRLVPYKGVAVLIDAMRQVDATLVVVGDGPQRKRLERRATSCGLQGRVRFTGHVSNEERSAYYRAADVFVLPSTTRAETFGIAMLEAMSLGTPAISTEVGTATSSVNRTGETGMVVAAGDAGALSDALRRLLGDRRLRQAMGGAAAHRAAQRFSKQVMVEGYADLYRSVASPAHAASSRAGAVADGVDASG